MQNSTFFQKSGLLFIVFIALQTATWSITFTTHSVRQDNGLDGASDTFVINVDGDTDVDILSASYSLNELAWWENDGSQHYTKHIITSSFDHPVDVFAIDLDKDGDVDILAASYGNLAGQGEIAWWENNGSESFTQHSIKSGFEDATRVYVTDINNDGELDVVGSSFTNGMILWWKNDGNENVT